MTRSLFPLLLSAVTILVLAGCASDFEGRDGESAEGLRVTAEGYHNNWPFQSEGGILECRSSEAAVFHSKGDSYALNDAALEQNYTPVADIRKKGGKLGREHYDVAKNSGDLSPNIRSYEQFLEAFGNTEVYYNEYPDLVSQFRGDLTPMADLALTLC
ncbi:MAG: hypothetical protein BZY88_03735 [SAR202 cluster bacterium Io17-Chloro-G9]|nr:MAG: hypothetical protein BZY88_03735 [SAR202 cluster bacterium Io17-Chloro-G9]